MNPHTAPTPATTATATAEPLVQQVHTDDASCSSRSTSEASSTQPAQTVSFGGKNNKVVVRRLPLTLTEDEVKELFAEFGTIVRVVFVAGTPQPEAIVNRKVVKTTMGEPSTVVIFDNEQEAIKAARGMSGRSVGGNNLIVSITSTTPPASPAADSPNLTPSQASKDQMASLNVSTTSSNLTFALGGSHSPRAASDAKKPQQQQSPPIHGHTSPPLSLSGSVSSSSGIQYHVLPPPGAANSVPLPPVYAVHQQQPVAVPMQPSQQHVLVAAHQAPQQVVYHQVAPPPQQHVLIQQPSQQQQVMYYTTQQPAPPMMAAPPQPQHIMVTSAPPPQHFVQYNGAPTQQQLPPGHYVM